MQSKTPFITQIVTNVAIVVGLAVVIYEIYQTRQLAEAQLVGEAYTLAQSTNAMVAGERIAEVLARACFEPDKLTNEDTVVLDAYFEARWTSVSRMIVLRQYDFPTPVGQIVQETLPRIVSFPAGREWYRLQRDNLDPEIRAIADATFESLDGQVCANYLLEFTAYQRR